MDSTPGSGNDLLCGLRKIDPPPHFTSLACLAVLSVTISLGTESYCA